MDDVQAVMLVMEQSVSPDRLAKIGHAFRKFIAILFNEINLSL